MNRPIQTILMRRLSGELPLTRHQQPRPQESAMQTLHREHLASLGSRGKTSDLFCIYHQVQEAGPSAVNWPEDLPKSSEKATELRAQGEELMALEDVFRHDEALKKYNESLCWAEPGSEGMALGYAARAKVCLENQEYEFALYNVALARKQPNCCSTDLLEELTTCETKCREQIAEGKSYANVPFARLPMRLEPNPRIPFLAKGIAMKTDPDYGRCLIPNDIFFQPGDVILQEEALVAMNDPKFRLVNCNYCTEMKAFQLIPCPGCCSVMYCSEECLQKDQAVHRFECGIGEKLNYLYTPNAIGPRMFFTGLALFNDDIVEMRKFCESHKRSGANPLELDYRNDEGLELEKFKNFHQVKFPNFDANQRRQFAFAACLYHQAYLKHPLVQGLFVTEPNRKFMLRYFYDYMQALAYLNVTRWNKAVNAFFPIASICNHSCEPDAIVTGGTRTLKLVALKMLDPDEQIFISYGPHWYHDFPNKPHGTRAQLGFECVCKVCNPFERHFWIQMGTQFGPRAIKHFEMVQMVNADSRAPHAAKLNMMQQFLEKFDVDYPNDEICSVMANYLDGLRKASVEERLAVARREARERADKML
uniref:Histone tail methylase n=1 Tax=Culex tarsalis TaxID=7177 RepID=A0A1Q3EVK6_CULTA